MSVTLTQLRTQARQKADMVNSSFITDDELNTMLNLSYSELYDHLVGTFEDYYSNELDFIIPSGSTYPLPDDFYKLRGLDLNENGYYRNVPPFNFQERNNYNNVLITEPLRGFSSVRYRVYGNVLKFYPEEIAAGLSFRMYYIPRFTPMQAATKATLLQNNLVLTAVSAGTDGNNISLTLTGGATANLEAVTVSDNSITVQIANGITTTAAVQVAIAGNSAAAALVTPSVIGSGNTPQVVAPQVFLSGGTADGTADGVNGWEEIIILDAAIKMLAKEESSTTVLERQKAMMMQRIQRMAADRDASMPERVSDVTGWQRTGPLGMAPWM